MEENARTRRRRRQTVSFKFRKTCKYSRVLLFVALLSHLSLFAACRRTSICFIGAQLQIAICGIERLRSSGASSDHLITLDIMRVAVTRDRALLALGSDEEIV